MVSICRVLSFLIFWVFVAGADQAVAQPFLSLAPVISGLSSPVQLTHAGDGSNRLFVVEKGGNIKVFSGGFAPLGTFLTVTGLSTSGEQGLLSLAFHPEYHTNGLFFVYYVNAAGNLELARFNVSSGNINQADAASRKVVLTINHPTNSNHNGGEIHFGADGFLYLSTGDGGGGGDPNNNSQNTSSLLGKLLRIQVNNSATAPFYQIPAGNPFGNEVFAYGLRNPFRWSFDRYNQDIWIGDVGQDAFEEIDQVPMASASGANFGWRCYEGNNVYNNSGCSGSNYIFPVYPYVTQNPSASVVGGTVYRGYVYQNMRGYYIAADYYSGVFYKITYNTSTSSWNTTTQTISSPLQVSDFGENEAGELFLCVNGGGSVYRVVSDGTVNTTYVFIGNGDWSNPSNWAGGAVPPASLHNAIIIIKPRNGGVCNLDIVQTIFSDASLVIERGELLNISSNLNLVK
ncbi:MAG: PQQ-dependent sugar dehydrogenase [Saprospiraceae bacterium]|nr:PQQ-dependent sugar dehydrogenase [Saprospiraceae bacterium]